MFPCKYLLTIGKYILIAFITILSISTAYIQKIDHYNDVNISYSMVEKNHRVVTTLKSPFVFYSNYSQQSTCLNPRINKMAITICNETIKFFFENYIILFY